MSAVVAALYAHPYPTLAAVRGQCLGGGLEVALACDMLFVEESAVLAAPEIRLGVFAPAATVLLQSSVPRCVAAEVLLTGRNLSAEEAQRWGLVNRVVADGELDAAVGTIEAAGFEGEVSRTQSCGSLEQGHASSAHCVGIDLDADLAANATVNPRSGDLAQTVEMSA